MNYMSPELREQSKIKNAIRTSKLMEFRSLVSGNAMKRQRINIDNNEFQAHPVMSFLKPQV